MEYNTQKKLSTLKGPYQQLNNYAMPAYINSYIDCDKELNKQARKFTQLD